MTLMKMFLARMTAGCVLALASVVGLAQNDPQIQPLTPPATNPPVESQPVVPPPTAAQPLPSTDLTPVPSDSTTLAQPPSTPAKGEKAQKPKAPPPPGTAFSGTLSAVDKTAMTILVETKQNSRTLFVTSKTRFTKDGKPALFGDGVIGEEVAGYYKKAKGGDLQALTVRYGAKTAAKKSPAKSSSTPPKSKRTTSPASDAAVKN